MQYPKDPKSTRPDRVPDALQSKEARVAILETEVDELYATALNLLDVWTALRDELLQASASRNAHQH